MIELSSLPILFQPLAKLASAFLGTLSIRQDLDAGETYFYTPDADDNRNRHVDIYVSYTIFNFGFTLQSAYELRVHSVDAYVYHDHYRDWITLDDCYSQPAASLHLREYLENFEERRPVFTAFDLLPKAAQKISFRKIGNFPTSLTSTGNRWGHLILIFHINTNYLVVLSQIPEMSARNRGGGIIKTWQFSKPDYDKKAIFRPRLEYNDSSGRKSTSPKVVLQRKFG
jgi:hypothetical protein